MAKKYRVTPAMKKALERIKRRGGGVRQHEGEYVDIAGETVNVRTLTCLLRAGLMVSSGDSLFGSQPQTYRVV